MLIYNNNHILRGTAFSIAGSENEICVIKLKGYEAFSECKV